MSDWEDKLNAILGNPDAMGQIMSLAQSLGGTVSPPQEPPAAASPPSPPPSAGPDLSALLGGLSGGGGLDPRLFSLAARILSESNHGDDRRTALLEALRPFVKEQRYAKLDKAIQIARLSHMIRIALDVLKGGGTDHV